MQSCIRVFCRRIPPLAACSMCPKICVEEARLFQQVGRADTQRWRPSAAFFDEKWLLVMGSRWDHADVIRSLRGTFGRSLETRQWLDSALL